jgi:hypothetical protein
VHVDELLFVSVSATYVLPAAPCCCPTPSLSWLVRQRLLVVVPEPDVVEVVPAVVLVVALVVGVVPVDEVVVVVPDDDPPESELHPATASNANAANAAVAPM